MGRCLHPGERVITEFLVAGNPGWTHALKVSFWIWLATSSVVFTLGQFGGTIIFFAGYILVTTSLPLFGGDWRGMRQSASGGVYLPAFSVFPIQFNSIARVFLKVNLVRIVAASPLILSFAVLAAYRLNQPLAAGLVNAAKLLALLLCAQPMFVVLPISRTTNDGVRARALTKYLVLLPMLLVVIGAAIGVFLGGNPAIVLASYVIIIAISGLLFVSYRTAYRRGRFDLLTERSPRG
jgi:hypothetical protein